MSRSDLEDAGDFLENVNEIHRLIDGLREGTISPEYVDKKMGLKKAKAEEKQSELNRCIVSSSSSSRLLQGTTMNSKNEDSNEQALKQDSEEVKKERLMDKVRELQHNHERKLRARQRYEEYVKNTTQSSDGVTKKASTGTDYAKWDLYCPEDEEDEMFNNLTPNNPQFRAMEKDINDRHNRMIEQRQLAERARVKGNDAFKAKQFAEALRCYELGLESEKTNMALHANAAMAALKLNCYVQAIEHCDKVFRLAEFIYERPKDPLVIKCYQRRSEAYLALDDPKLAMKDLETALDLDPRNNEIQEQLKRAEAARDLARKKRLLTKAAKTEEKTPDATPRSAFSFAGKPEKERKGSDELPTVVAAAAAEGDKTSLKKPLENPEGSSELLASSICNKSPGLDGEKMKEIAKLSSLFFEIGIQKRRTEVETDGSKTSDDAAISSLDPENEEPSRNLDPDSPSPPPLSARAAAATPKGLLSLDKRTPRKQQSGPSAAKGPGREAGSGIEGDADANTAIIRLCASLQSLLKDDEMAQIQIQQSGGLEGLAWRLGRACRGEEGKRGEGGEGRVNKKEEKEKGNDFSSTPSSKASFHSKTPLSSTPPSSIPAPLSPIPTSPTPLPTPPPLTTSAAQRIALLSLLNDACLLDSSAVLLAAQAAAAALGPSYRASNPAAAAAAAPPRPAAARDVPGMPVPAKVFHGAMAVCVDTLSRTAVAVVEATDWQAKVLGAGGGGGGGGNTNGDGALPKAMMAKAVAVAEAVQEAFEEGLAALQLLCTLSSVPAARVALSDAFGSKILCATAELLAAARNVESNIQDLRAWRAKLQQWMGPKSGDDEKLLKSLERRMIQSTITPAAVVRLKGLSLLGNLMVDYPCKAALKAALQAHYKALLSDSEIPNEHAFIQKLLDCLQDALMAPERALEEEGRKNGRKGGVEKGMRKETDETDNPSVLSNQFADTARRMLLTLSVAAAEERKRRREREQEEEEKATTESDTSFAPHVLCAAERAAVVVGNACGDATIRALFDARCVQILDGLLSSTGILTAAAAADYVVSSSSSSPSSSSSLLARQFRRHLWNAISACTSALHNVSVETATHPFLVASEMPDLLVRQFGRETDKSTASGNEYATSTDPKKWMVFLKEVLQYTQKVKYGEAGNVRGDKDDSSNQNDSSMNDAEVNDHHQHHDNNNAKQTTDDGSKGPSSNPAIISDTAVITCMARITGIYARCSKLPTVMTQAVTQAALNPPLNLATALIRTALAGLEDVKDVEVVRTNHQNSCRATVVVKRKPRVIVTVMTDNSSSTGGSSENNDDPKVQIQKAVDLREALTSLLEASVRLLTVLLTNFEKVFAASGKRAGKGNLAASAAAADPDSVDQFAIGSSQGLDLIVSILRNLSLGEMVLGNAALCMSMLVQREASESSYKTLRYGKQLASLDAVAALVDVALQGQGNTATRNAAIAMAKAAQMDKKMLDRLRELRGFEIIQRYVRP